MDDKNILQQPKRVLRQDLRQMLSGHGYSAVLCSKMIIERICVCVVHCYLTPKLFQRKAWLDKSVIGIMVSILLKSFLRK